MCFICTHASVSVHLETAEGNWWLYQVTVQWPVMLPGASCHLWHLTRLTFASLIHGVTGCLFLICISLCFFFFLPCHRCYISEPWVFFQQMPFCLREPDWVSLMSDLHLHLLSLLRLDSMEAEMLGLVSTLCPSRSVKNADAWFTDSSFLKGRGVGGWQSIQGFWSTCLLLTHITHAQKGFGKLCPTPCVRRKGFRHRENGLFG